MEPILDTPFNEPRYVGFGERLGALIIDGFITGIPLGALTFYNLLVLKSLPLLIVINVLALAYKPILEGLNGATVGKKALKIKVVDANFGKASWTNILLKNSLHILLSVLSLIPTILLFSDADFLDVDSFSEYNVFAAQQQNENYFSIIVAAIYLIDMIFMLTDRQKRSLHDRIGSTFVVKDEPAVLA